MKKTAEKITIRKFDPELPLDQIKIADTNVRKTRPRSRLEELKTSISRFGLIHPIIVIQTGKDEYKLVVGQRRFLAFEELGRKTIPALIISALDSLDQSIISFSENIHRRDLPYEDTIRICAALFKEYRGHKVERIRRISQELGIPPSTVSSYVSYILIPPEVRKLVPKVLTRDQAKRLTEAFWPNTQKILKIAHRIARFTREERERVLEIGKKRPEASEDEIVEEALKEPQTVEIVISLDPETHELLVKIAEKRGTDVETFVKQQIEELLPDLKEELK